MEHRFRGVATNRVDAKGRVSIPADFRRVLDVCDPGRDPGTNARVTVCFGDDRFPYFTCYTMAGVAEMGEMIEDMDEGDPDREALEDYFYTYAETITVDETGRLLLNKALRDRIGVESDLCFAGKGKTFRVYAPAAPEETTSVLKSRLATLDGKAPVTSLLPRKRRAEA